MQSEVGDPSGNTCSLFDLDHELPIKGEARYFNKDLQSFPQIRSGETEIIPLHF